MKQRSMEGKVATVIEADSSDQEYTCLSVHPRHGNNEANLFLDAGDNRTTWDIYIQDVRSILRFDVLSHGEHDESLNLVIIHKDGSRTYLNLECSLNALLTAIEAERMAIEATSREGNLS